MGHNTGNDHTKRIDNHIQNGPSIWRSDNTY